MPLDQIADFLQNRDIDVREDKLLKQKELVIKKQQELAIRKLEEHQTQPVVFLGKVGVGIAKDKLLTGQFTQYDSVFLVLDEEDVYEGMVEQQPPQLCVSMCFCGSHNEAAGHYRELMEYIDKHKMEVTGFSREITMIDYGITDDTEKFVTEIRIPVKCS